MYSNDQMLTKIVTMPVYGKNNLKNSSIYLFSPFLWETTQNDPQGVNVSLNPNTIKTKIYCLQRFSFLYGRGWKYTSLPLFPYDWQPLTMQLDGILSVCIPVLLTVHGHPHLNFHQHLIWLILLSWIWLGKTHVNFSSGLDFFAVKLTIEDGD